jgi:FixJ family two-component response regulator
MKSGHRIDPPVWVVDDDSSIRRSIRRALETDGHRVECSASAEDVLTRLDGHRPACMVMDIGMSGIGGITDLPGRLRERGIDAPVIFLTAAADVQATAAVMKRGAADVLLKPCDVNALREAVRQAMATDAAHRQRRDQLRDIRRRMAKLTPREHEVAILLASGSINKQIAAKLGLSERTVEIHRGRVMAKMGTDSIARFAVQWAMAS